MRNNDRAGREKRGFAPRQGGKNPPRPARLARTGGAKATRYLL